MKDLFIPIICSIVLALFTCVSAHAEEEEIMVILDASGSMWGRIDEQPKIEIARDVMSKVLKDLDGKANIGVITYGHRKKGQCSDIEAIIPVGKVDHDRYMSVINKLSPKGKTPITDAVLMGAETLKYTEQKATVVLISDGLETCEADPCTLAKALESKGIDFTAHVIGFDLKGKDTTSLQCLAEETGGKYLSAENADELGDAVGTVVAEAPTETPAPQPDPEPEPVPTTLKVDVLLSEGSEPLERGVYIYVIPDAENKNKSKAVKAGSPNNPIKLKSGKYYIEASIGKAFGSIETEVKADAENRATVVLNAGFLSVKAAEKEGGEPNTKAYIYIDEANTNIDGGRKNITGANQRHVFVLPAGKYHARAKLGKATVGQEVEVIAGEQTDALLVLQSGLLQVNALNEEGGEPQTSGAYAYIFEAEQKADGKRQQVTGANPRNPFTLPAGKYYVEVKIGNARVGQEVEVIAGQLTTVDIVASVGVFQATVVPTEGGKPLDKAYITIFEKEKQLDGSRKRITGANVRQVFKLPAGEYFAVAKIDTVQLGQDFSVSAGKRTEMTLNVNAGALLVEASKRVYVTLYASEKNLDGTRDRVTGFRPGKAVMLTAGKYFMEAKLGDNLIEKEVEIKAGKLNEQQLDL
ncbi:MAG: VWA domain-containing protein [Pseudomonadota bacterium]